MWDLVGNPKDRFSQNEAQLTIKAPNNNIAEFVDTANTVDPDETADRYNECRMFAFYGIVFKFSAITLVIARFG